MFKASSLALLLLMASNSLIADEQYKTVQELDQGLNLKTTLPQGAYGYFIRVGKEIEKKDAARASLYYNWIAKNFKDNPAALSTFSGNLSAQVANTSNPFLAMRAAIKAGIDSMSTGYPVVDTYKQGLTFPLLEAGWNKIEDLKPAVEAYNSYIGDKKIEADVVDLYAIAPDAYGRKIIEEASSQLQNNKDIDPTDGLFFSYANARLIVPSNVQY